MHMSGHVKGTRKQKPGVIRDFNFVGFRISFGAMVIALLAVLYLIFLIGIKLEKGMDALALKVVSLAIFTLFAYLVHKDILHLKPFTKIIDIFVGLSILPIFWDLAQFFYLYDPAKFSDVNGLAIINTANAILSIIIVILILYYEKDKLADIYVKVGKFVPGLTTGLIGLATCVALAMGGVYFLNGPALSNAGTTLIALIIFSLMGAIAEELWFRGMLLSRILQIIDRDRAIALQAAIFAVYEALVVYTLMPQLLFVAIVLVAALLPGYYWGRMTVQNDSILGPVLFHTGFYVLMATPLFFGML